MARPHESVGGPVRQTGVVLQGVTPRNPNLFHTPPPVESSAKPFAADRRGCHAETYSLLRNQTVRTWVAGPATTGFARYAGRYAVRTEIKTIKGRPYD